MVVNPHQVDEDALGGNPEEYLKGQAQAAMQALINRRVHLAAMKERPVSRHAYIFYPVY